MDLKKRAAAVKESELLWDLLLLAGAALFVYGMALAWRPLGFILGGLLLAVAAFLNGYGSPRRGQWR